MDLERRRRWLAMLVLCLGDLMIVLDVTVVNVALPSIHRDLGFSDAALAWVVNAYMLTFGGFLLLGGRLGDLFGARRVFLIGVALFGAASLACGLAQSQAALIVARAVQGFAAAIVAAVVLSLIVNLFQEAEERAKAMGVFGFVSAGGGSVGVLLGGVITQTLSWRWIFWINVPVGLVVVAAALRLMPASLDRRAAGRLDVGGAVTITLSLLCAVYAIVNGNEAGWLSVQTIALLAVSLVLLGMFLVIEARVPAPLVPLWLFGLRSLQLSNGIAMLWSASMFATFFLSALFLQLVQGYDPLQIGLAFLPTNLIMAAFSLGLSAKVVMRFGIRGPVAIGMLVIAVGLALFARVPAGANFVVDVLPPMILFGLGAGVALNPLLLAAMGEVEQSQSGLASGLVNTAFMIGGALGLAILASVAAAQTRVMQVAGTETVAALLGGYHAAFAGGAVFALVAVGLALGLGNAAVQSPEMQPVGAGH